MSLVKPPGRVLEVVFTVERLVNEPLSEAVRLEIASGAAQAERGMTTAKIKMERIILLKMPL